LSLSHHEVQVHPFEANASSMLEMLDLSQDIIQDIDSPFSQVARYLQYEDDDLGEVDCMSIFESNGAWICMYIESDGTTVLVDVTSGSNAAIRIMGVGRVVVDVLKLPMLVRLAAINAGAWTIINAHDAFAAAVVLARTDYLQRDIVQLCLVDQEEKAVLGIGWLGMTTFMGTFFFFGLFWSTIWHRKNLHVPMSSWEWYLFGARKASGTVSAEDSQLPPNKMFDKEFGFSPTQHLTWTQELQALDAREPLCCCCC
jgi:hypothetical protein